MLVREVVPRIAVRAIVFADRGPLTFGEIRPPFFPAFPVAELLRQALLLRGLSRHGSTPRTQRCNDRNREQAGAHRNGDVLQPPRNLMLASLSLWWQPENTYNITESQGVARLQELLPHLKIIDEQTIGGESVKDGP